MPVREEKVRRVAELRERLSRARGLVLTEFRGLTVEEQTRLRRELRRVGVEFRVVKNTLTRIAARDAGVEAIEPFLVGPTAIAFGYDDPVVAVKELVRAARELRDNLSIKAAVVEGQVVAGDRVQAIADLPSRQELLGRVVGAAAAPLTGFAGALAGLLRRFAYAVDALRRKREAEAA